MPIISFWSNSDKETGQTIASVAIATMMAIEHNYKILLISTGFKDTTMYDSYWVQSNTSALQKTLGLNSNSVNTESGIEGLARIITSNRIRNGLIQDYAKVVFKGRLDVLTSPETKIKEEYLEITNVYPKLLEVAKQDYNLTFIDINKDMPEDVKQQILNMSDIVIININQNLRSINEIMELKQQNNELFKSNRAMILIGRYDKFSKYNVKNIMRYLKEKKEILSIPYNTLFFEVTSEGKVPDYLLKYRTISDKNDRNYIFISEAKKACDEIIYKIQELRLSKRL